MSPAPKPLGIYQASWESAWGGGGGLEGGQCTLGLGFSLCKFRGWDQMVSKGPHTLQGSGFSALVVHHSPLCREMPAPRALISDSLGPMGLKTVKDPR